MSFRNRGETLEEVMAGIERDVRYIYKCCEGGGGDVFYEVDVASGDESVDSEALTGRWYSRGGTASVRGLRLSSDETGFSDLVVEVRVTGVVVQTVVLPAAAATVEVLLGGPVALAANDYLSLSCSSGARSFVNAQVLMVGDWCGSGGLNWWFVGGGPE